MKKYLLIAFLAMALLVNTSAVFAAKGGVPGKPVPPPPDDGGYVPPPLPVQPFVARPPAQPFV